MLKVDTTTLADIVNQCFAFASDVRFTLPQQKALLADGKRLRGLLLNLLSAQFDDGTPAVVDANNQLVGVNNDLADATAALANVAKTLGDVANLVGNLDQLLNIAVSFI